MAKLHQSGKNKSKDVGSSGHAVHTKVGGLEMGSITLLSLSRNLDFITGKTTQAVVKAQLLRVRNIYDSKNYIWDIIL